jgi:hypothetical protein
MIILINNSRYIEFLVQCVRLLSRCGQCFTVDWIVFFDDCQQIAIIRSDLVGVVAYKDIALETFARHPRYALLTRYFSRRSAE